MGKIILHIDFDSFFASVEQELNPLLRNKPIGVTAANGRTCIIASSREAKVLGIKTGTRSYEAFKIYPQLILVKADFVKYFEISRKFLNICKDYSPYIELFSIDELFMDITQSAHLFNGAYGIIKVIKKRIREEIGEYITVSVGISHNKMLAKMASNLAKTKRPPATPERSDGGRGMFEINKENVEAVYEKAKLTDICGIGERINERLSKIGISDLMDLRKTSLSFLIAEFGHHEANFLKNASMGTDNSPVNSYSDLVDVKSVSRNYCLPKNEYDKKIVMQNIYELCEEVGIKLRRLNVKARTVGLSLRGSDNFHARKTHDAYFDTGKEIFEACLSFSSSHLSGGNSVYVRQISVWVSNLENEKNIPLSLFDSAKKNKLTSAIDAINEKFGDHTIRNGFLLHADKLTTVPNGYS